MDCIYPGEVDQPVDVQMSYSVTGPKGNTPLNDVNTFMLFYLNIVLVSSFSENFSSHIGLDIALKGTTYLYLFARRLFFYQC